MDDRHRNLIKKNIGKLIERTQYEKLVKDCIRHGIITQVMRNNIEESEKVVTKRHEALLLKITQRGPDAFKKFESILVENNWRSAVGLIIEEQPYDAMASLRSGRPINSNNTTIIRQNQEPPNSQPPMAQPYKIVLKPYDSEKIINMWEIKGMKKIDRTEDKPAKNGIFMLVNYKKNRPQANDEKDYLLSLFHKLNFVLFYLEDQPYNYVQQFIIALKESAEYNKNPPPCFVYCHLGIGNMTDFIIDNHKVLIHDHLGVFNNKNFPAWSIRTKLFMFPSCNKEQMTSASKVSNEMDSAGNIENAGQPTSTAGTRADKTLPSYSDMTYFFLEHG